MMRTTYVIIGLLTLILLSACQKPVASIMPGDKSIVTQIEAPAVKQPAVANEPNPLMNPRTIAGTTTAYLSFDKRDYDQARMDNKIIVLNFYSNWCDECKQEQLDAFSAFNEMKYPNVIGFQVNYKDSDTSDDETGLAKDFGITVQNTKVIIKNGRNVVRSADI